MNDDVQSILIVDDEDSFLESIKEGLSLSDENFRIFTAKNGIEAIDIVNTQTVNLVITDLKMPEMGGYELVASLRRNHSDLPIIVMTAYGSSEMENNLIALGVSHYVNKPIEIESFTDKVKGVLSGEDYPLMSVEALEGELIEIIVSESAKNEGGEIIVKSDKDSGRVHLINGEIAWIMATTMKETLYSELIEKAGLDSSDLQRVFDECKLNGKNFGETVIEWGLIPRENFRQILLRHTSNALAEILLWEDSQMIFVNSNRTYNSVLTFKPEEVFTDMSNASPGKIKPKKFTSKRMDIAGMRELLESYKTLDKFIAAGIILPTGEIIAEVSINPVSFAKTCEMLNDVFLSSQLTVNIVGFGDCQSVQITAPEAEILIRDLGKGGKGGSPVRMIVVTEQESPMGLFKIQAEKIVNNLLVLLLPLTN
ncbi:MAG: response regulator [Desulfuromonadales bacterium]|nr:response regulator [Desulfuromonadales bacterium]